MCMRWCGCVLVQTPVGCVYHCGSPLARKSRPQAVTRCIDVLHHIAHSPLLLPLNPPIVTLFPLLFLLLLFLSFLLLLLSCLLLLSLLLLLLFSLPFLLLGRPDCSPPLGSSPLGLSSVHVTDRVAWSSVCVCVTERVCVCVCLSVCASVFACV